MSKESSRISSGVQPDPALSMALASKEGLGGSAGQPLTQGLTLPMSRRGEGEPASPGGPILINLSSLQARSYPTFRNDRLAPKPGIHKSARKASRTYPTPLSRAPAPASSRFEPNGQAFGSAGTPEECMAKLEPPGQKVEYYRENLRRYTHSRPSQSPQNEKPPEIVDQISSFAPPPRVPPENPRWNAEMPSNLPGEPYLFESGVLGGWRGGMPLPALNLSEPRGLRNEDLRFPLMAEPGSDHIDNLLDLVWGDEPTAVASTPGTGAQLAQQLAGSLSPGLRLREREMQAGELNNPSTRMMPRGFEVCGGELPSSLVPVRGAPLLPSYNAVISSTEGCFLPPVASSSVASSCMPSILGEPASRSTQDLCIYT